MAEESTGRQAVATVGGVAGAAGGWIFSQYVGASLWVPALVSIALFVVFAKTPVKPRLFAGAIAVTIGHVAWFLAGAAVLGVWEPVLLDVILLSAAVVVLWARPSVATAAVLGVLQLASLAYNVFVISIAAFGSVEHKALCVHIALRVIVLVALVLGLRRLRAAPAIPLDS